MVPYNWNSAHYFVGDPVCNCSNIQLIGQRNVPKAFIDGVYLDMNLHSLEVIFPWTWRDVTDSVFYTALFLKPQIR